MLLSQEIMPSENANEEEKRKVLAKVLDQHGSKWFKFVLRMLGNQADAEDVVQEAAHRVLMCGHPLPSEDQLRMYLSRAIFNLAIEAYKRRKRERKSRIPFIDDARVGTVALSPYLQLEEREEQNEKMRLLHIMHMGLSKLPSKQYEALRMTFLEPIESSIRDCSQTTGIPYSTLRHRTMTGLRGLRRFIHRAMRSVRLVHLLS
jgi:RNA polymerase sigma factor (sigma-70 family)